MYRIRLRPIPWDLGQGYEFGKLGMSNDFVRSISLFSKLVYEGIILVAFPSCWPYPSSSPELEGFLHQNSLERRRR